jgi:hypothetical protein
LVFALHNHQYFSFTEEQVTIEKHENKTQKLMFVATSMLSLLMNPSKCPLQAFYFYHFPFSYIVHGSGLHSDMAQPENLHPGFFHVLFIANIGYTVPHSQTATVTWPHCHLLLCPMSYSAPVYFVLSLFTGQGTSKVIIYMHSCCMNASESLSL